jgi:hypothetical protein
MTWHVDEATIARYVSDEVDRVAASSIETHLTSCGACRAKVTIDADQLAMSWTAVRAAIEAPSTGWFETALRTFGIRPHVARLLAVTPGLRMSWVLALVVAVGFGLLAAGSTDSLFVGRWFLAVAPIVPVAGVIIGFSAMADPAHELGLAVPLDRFWLTMVRSLLVAGSAMGMLLIVDVAIGVGASSGAWLVPATAATCLTLALAPRVGTVGAASTVAIIWLLLVLGISGGGTPVLSGSVQLMGAVVALAALVVLGMERDRFRRGEVWL